MQQSKTTDRLRLTIMRCVCDLLVMNNFAPLLTSDTHAFCHWAYYLTIFIICTYTFITARPDIPLQDDSILSLSTSQIKKNCAGALETFKIHEVIPAPVANIRSSIETQHGLEHCTQSMWWVCSGLALRCFHKTIPSSQRARNFPLLKKMSRNSTLSMTARRFSEHSHCPRRKSVDCWALEDEDTDGKFLPSASSSRLNHQEEELTARPLRTQTRKCFYRQPVRQYRQSLYIRWQSIHALSSSLSSSLVKSCTQLVTGAKRRRTL